jgi:acyl-CoA synthetase (NDP forming)
MFLIGLPVAGEGYDVPAMAETTARFMRASGKPVVISAPQSSVREAFRACGIPAYGHETEALQALQQVSRHAQRVQAAGRRRHEPLVDAIELPRSDGRLLSEADSLALLQRAQLPVVPYRLCHSPQEALQAWRELGPDVVVKACCAAIPHKSEHGLVMLDRRTEGDVLRAYEECVSRIHALGHRSEGVVVAKRVRGQREFALGVKQDAQFGTTVMISDGGKYVEALKDFVVLLYPFGEEDVLDKLRGLRIAPILAGVRGEPPVDLSAVARAAVALGRFAAARADEIAAIDVNPLIVAAAGHGGWAVDAVIERKEGNDHA